MKKEKLPLKTVLLTGILNGFFFAIAMAAFDYFSHEPFSLNKFLFHFGFFGFFMAITFKYKYTREEK